MYLKYKPLRWLVKKPKISKLREVYHHEFIARIITFTGPIYVTGHKKRMSDLFYIKIQWINP